MTKKANTKKVKAQAVILPALNKGEVWRGIVPDAKGKPLYHLIELTGDHGSADWNKAGELAKKAGYALPDRRDGALLRASDSFDLRGWFWLSEPYAGNDAFAWCQDFGYGSQYCNLKDNTTRARFVRREAIR